jgi:hypothetical protein
MDVVTVTIVLVLSTMALVRMSEAGAAGDDGAVAIVSVGDRVLERLPLDQDAVLRLRDVGMVFEVRDGRIRAVESDCPHHVCENMGWVGRSGQIIACVPNHVVVRISEPEEPFLDAVVQ